MANDHDVPELSGSTGEVIDRGQPDVDDRGHLSYLPSLDGIRALSVLGVMAYHGGIPFLTAGFLGVDSFFVLSGFLITTLLVNEFGHHSTIGLRSFWARRARRLLPGLIILLLGVAAYAAYAVPAGTYPNLRLDVVSTLLYVANWHFILAGSNYFVANGPVSPLTHTWSLAIEEQFYVVWPLIVLGVLALTRSLKVLLGVAVVGAAASAAEMAYLFHHHSATTRLYYGTDTHAQSLLIGAALACGLALWAKRRRASSFMEHLPARLRLNRGGDPMWTTVTRSGSVAMTLIGLAGLGITIEAWRQLNGNSSRLYQGGFFVVGLAVAALVCSIVTNQSGPLSQLLSVPPLRFLGRISYGMYLYHFPLFLYLDHARLGLSEYPLFGVRCAVTIAAASVSYYAIERPIRRGIAVRGWQAWVATPLVAVGVVIAVIAATEIPAVAAVAPPPVTAIGHGPQVKLLTLGDSTALTLGLGFGVEAKKYDLVTLDKGIIGCGVVEGSAVQVMGSNAPTWPACNGTDKTSVEDGQTVIPWNLQWKFYVDFFRPNVVMILVGRWEIVNRSYKGKWTNILNPTYARYVKSQLQKGVDIATSGGAKVELLTAPCYNEGEQPDGSPWPEDSPARIDAFNKIVREVGAANPSRVQVYDLNALVCPDGHYEPYLNGVNIRTPDGVHFTIPGGEYLSRYILPRIVALGRTQIAQSKKS